MSYKDTLTLYEEQVANGVSNEQAKIIAHQLGSVGDNFSNAIKNINENLIKLDKDIIKLDKDMFWIRMVGSAMTLAFFSNIVAIAWMK